MERNEIHTICRLCLSENYNLTHVFESKGIQGWTAADGIRELLRIQVSPDDIYPQSVCVECIGKLEDFKIFKERCETSKELLDRAFAAKRGIGLNEEFIEGASNFMENRGELHLKEEDPNIPLEKDPLELTEEEKPIKSEIGNCNHVSNEIAPNEEIESASDPYIPDKNQDEDTQMNLETDRKRLPSSLSLSALGSNEMIREPNGHCSKLMEVSDNWCIKEEVVDITAEVDPHEMLQEEETIVSGHQSCNIFSMGSDCLRNRNESHSPYSTWEICPNTKSSSYSLGCSNVTREHVTSTKDRKGDISNASEGCSNPRGNKLNIVTAGLSSANKGLIFSCSDCCQSYSALHYLQLHRVREHGISLPDRSSRPENVCIQIKGGSSNEESKRRRLFPTGIHDPLHLPFDATTIERKEQRGKFTVISYPRNPRDDESGKMKSAKDSSSSVHSAAGEKPNSSSYMKALGPQTHESIEEVSQSGNDLEYGRSEEMRNIGGSEHRLEENENNYQCNSCGICFDVKENLGKHIESHCSKEMCDPKVYFPSEVVGGTPLVGIKQSIDRKREIKLKCKRGYECEVCNKKFTNSGNLKAHLRIHSGERPFKCGECEKAFSEASSLRRHVAIHTGVKQHSCTQCGKAFKRREHLECHMRIHTGDKPFQCIECEKRFNDRSHLRRHLRIHSDGKPFCCEECGKRFNDNGALQCHLRMHIGEKPFECEVCNKGFSQRSNLKVHLRIHSGENPFGCTECGKRFNESGALQCHLRIHTGEKPFKCGECDTCFSTRNSLRRHQRTHSGDKPFSCTECRRRFTRNAHLKKHIQTHVLERRNE